jgi:hypothetical protein
MTREEQVERKARDIYIEALREILDESSLTVMMKSTPWGCWWLSRFVITVSKRIQ